MAFGDRDGLICELVNQFRDYLERCSNDEIKHIVWLLSQLNRDG